MRTICNQRDAVVYGGLFTLVPIGQDVCEWQAPCYPEFGPGTACNPLWNPCVAATAQGVGVMYRYVQSNTPCDDGAPPVE